jgi:hypothetical protein
MQNYVADSQLAPKLLSVIGEDAMVTGLCDTNPTHNINCHRLLVLFLGISPGAPRPGRRPAIPAKPD